MGKYLIVGDMDQIQPFVFASSRLRAIRGASTLLEQAVESFKQSWSGAKTLEFLRWRGGQVVVVLEGSIKKARKFQKGLEAAIRRASDGTATMTTEAVSYKETDFRGTLNQAFRQIRGEKDGRQDEGAAGSALLTNSYYHRCTLLPTRAAEVFRLIGEEDDAEASYLSRAAAMRWNAVQSIQLDRELLDRLRKADAEFAADQREIALPYDLEDLWPDDEGGYMAMIAADGNSIGQMLETIVSQGRYKDFSDELHNLSLEAIVEAMRAAKITKPYLKRKPRGRIKHYLPLIPVIVAGDDINLLVRAEHAVSFMENLCVKFSERSQIKNPIQCVIDDFCCAPNYRAAAQQLFPGRFDRTSGVPLQVLPQQTEALTLSIGVAIAKRKFPISIYRRLANELRDRAKVELRKRPRESVGHGGMIDFAVITSSTVQSLDELRSHYRSEPGNVRLTARPYTLRAFQKLHALAKEIRESVPRSKRKFLYQQLFAGSLAGQEAYEFVMRREKRREQIDTAMQELGKVHPALRSLAFNAGSAFSTSRYEEPMTLLVDALELAELLEMGEEA